MVDEADRPTSPDKVVWEVDSESDSVSSGRNAFKRARTRVDGGGAGARYTPMIFSHVYRGI